MVDSTQPPAVLKPPWPQTEFVAPLELAEPLDLRPLDWQPSTPPPSAEAPASAVSLRGAHRHVSQPADATESNSAAFDTTTGSQVSKRITSKRQPLAKGLRQGFLTSKSSNRQQQPASTAKEGSLQPASRSLRAEKSKVLHPGKGAKDVDTAAPLPFTGTAPSLPAKTSVTNTSPAASMTTHSAAPGLAAVVSLPAAGTGSAAAPHQSSSSNPTHLRNPHDNDDDINEDAYGERTSTLAAAPLQPPSQADTARAFSQVQPHCAAIMQSRDQPGVLTDHLLGLRHAIAQAPLPGLQACLDYILLPLMHLIDSIATTQPRTGAACCWHTLH